MNKQIILSVLIVFLSVVAYAQNEATEICSKSKMSKYKSVIQFRDTGNQDDFDINYYKLNLEIFPAAKKIDGIVDIHSLCLKSGLKRLDLDLTSSLTVKKVKIKDKNLLFDHDYTTNVLKVFLDKVYSKGEEIDISIEYIGQPGNSFKFDEKDGNPWVWTFTEPYGSLDWFPCKNLPKDKADSVDLIITVPENLIVASNGLLVDKVTSNSKTTYTWKERYPIATYLISLAIHPFEVRTDYFIHGENDSMPVVNYIIPSQFNNNNTKYGNVPEMLEAFTYFFGEYPFIEEKYGNVEVPLNGGMEHQTLTSLLGPYEHLLTHELAHQWWGDMVTCENFHHIWLNEGFATYSEALWVEYKYGKEAYSDKMNSRKYLGEGTIYVEDITTNPREIFDGSLSYSKASWVLHMLRHIVGGDDKFFSILKSYAKSAKRYGVVNTDDFEFICEKVSGKDLGDFFDQWIYGDFHPVYLYDWGYKKEGEDYSLSLNIEQFQTQNLFSMPIDITIVTETGEENFVIDNYQKLQGYDFTLNSKPISVTIDKNDWILKEVKEGLTLVNQDNNEMILSLSNFGSFGFDEPDGFGNGLIYPRDRKNILYMGSLMFGNDNNYVADISENDGHNDFSKLFGSKIETNSTTISNLDINIKYSDSLHMNSKGISVDQTSYSWNQDPYRDFILFKFDLINNGTENLENFYISQFMDFDIEDYTENYVQKNESKRLLYQYIDGLYSGVKLLDNSDKIKFVSISDAVDNLVESKKFEYLSGLKNDFKVNKKGDWSTMLSVGPYDFNIGDTITINFGVIGGTNKENFISNSNNAQYLFDKYLVSNDNDFIDKNKNYVKIFPNPIQNKINLELFLDRSQDVIIRVFNTKGEIVYSDKSFYNSGGNSITINRPLKPGMYFYKINTTTGFLTGKIIK